jgi:hypothetical protein
LKRLRLVPEGFEDWRPVNGAMSFADLAQHLVDADKWLFRKLKMKNLKPMIGKSHVFDSIDRAGYLNLVAELERCGVQRSDLLESISGTELSEIIYDSRFGNVTVWWVVVRGNLDHEAHHRGQIACYLRILESR